MLETLGLLDLELDACSWTPSEEIHLDDWDALADLLPMGYAADVADCIFQQRVKAPPAAIIATGRKTKTKAPASGNGILPSLSDEQLQQLVEAIKRAGCPPFTQLKPTLEIKKADGKALSQIMGHVVAWVNPRPTDTKRTCNNKPPLCKDLEPAFRDMGSSENASEIARLAVKLEQDVLEHALGLSPELGRLSGQELEVLPDGGDDAIGGEYDERFSRSDLWRGVLEIVRRSLGPNVRAGWIATPPGSPTAQERPESARELEVYREHVRQDIVALVDHVAGNDHIRHYPWAAKKGPFDRLRYILGRAVVDWQKDENDAFKEGRTPNPRKSEAHPRRQGKHGDAGGSKESGSKGAHEDSELSRRLPPQSNRGLPSRKSLPSGRNAMAKSSKPPSSNSPRENRGAGVPAALHSSNNSDDSNNSDELEVLPPPNPAANSSKKPASSQRSRNARSDENEDGDEPGGPLRLVKAAKSMRKPASSQSSREAHVEEKQPKWADGRAAT